ncbi:unnamed protein product [Mytilus edulis]|uniref:Reverse transcriptase domain-containing protein n=1 Tax=Mytilus edulis TaxID=6550 RepID=A0A8S3QPW5_MYTED|nr:unnamed protein product [Mytilus edulis]
MQDDLTSSCDNPKEFWRKIGKIGIGAERQRNIPMEIKLEDVRLFNGCYNTLERSCSMGQGVIVQVPKCSSSDPRDPLSYRGKTLAPATYKLYCGILDSRLREKFDASDIIHDEQNGFRKDRNTIDHLLSVTSIIESRKLRKQSTYAAFIDFKRYYK